MKYSTMEFDNETTFEEFTTTIDTLDLDKEKDLPALTCVDLFPDPPHLIATSDEPQKGGSLADDDEFAGFKLIDNKPDGINHPEVIDDDDDDDVCLTSETAAVINQTDNSKEEVVLSKMASPSSHQGSVKTPTAGINATASAPVSPASYFSSAESVSSAVSSSKKTKKRYCRECDVHFRKTRELHEHLKTHIKMPDVRLEKLSDNNEKVKEYLCSLSPKPSPTHGSLKLKLKLLSSQNFEVVPHEKEAKPAEIDSRVQILKAADIKCKSETFENINREPFAQNPGSKPPNSFLQPENRYFECPTFDGLDAFADDMNSGEATEDLLKKLLENNKEPQLFQKEPDWPANANEFISIDSLAPRCNVCHMNFSHPKYLYEHKQITGHDFHNRMAEPIPPTHSEFRHHQQNAYMQGTPPPPPQNLPPLYQMAQMRGNFPGYGPRLNVRHMMHHPPQPSPPPGFHPPQCMIPRTPPPLYRVNGNPSNFPPNQYMDKRPEMYGPPPPQFQNGNQHLNPEMMRQPIFLKSRLQKAIRGRSQGLTNEIPTAPGILTQQTAIRPRFLGPNPQMAGHMQFQRTRPLSPPKQGEPPTKRVKVESAQNHFSASPSPSSSNGIVSPGISNSPGMPIIHSVHSGINASNFPQMNEKSKETSLNDQTSPTVKGTIKNPKDVANILATRGITVTHKGKSSSAPSLANKGTNSSNSSAQEAVQKLQANNSVSIISKKKPTDINVCKPGNPGSESGHRISAKFLSCPVITCKEKFLTLEGVNRHAFRWHGIPMPNPDRTQKRIIRCRLCHHTCSSQETLQDHVRREHEPSVNEIGIPIVDLRNEEVKRKLAGLGIFNYVPLTAAGASTSSLAFPVVSVQGAANPSICNLLGLGASSVLSLGPVKSITVRKANSENK